MAATGLPSTDPKDLSDEADSEDTLASHELFWDKAVLFLATIITALTAVDFLSEIFRGDTEAVCFVPEELNTTESQDRYIQNFCSQNIRRIQYLPVFVLIHGFLIGALHYVWKSSFNNQFSYFFTHAKALCPFKDDDTGEYPYKNIVIIKKLQLKFSVYNRYRVLGWYRLKLVTQLCIALVSFIVSFVVFAENFDAEFDCPSAQSSSAWPYEGTVVKCISTSAQLFWLVRLVDVILLALVMAMLVWGILWMTLWPHAKELNYKQAALFTFTTGVESTFYISKSILFYLGTTYLNVFRWLSRKIRECFPRHFQTQVEPPYVPRICSDLHFFLLLLYRTDSSLGHAFYEGQVYLELKALKELDQWLIRSRLKGFKGVWNIDRKSKKQIEGISTGWEITGTGHRDRFWPHTEEEADGVLKTIPVPNNLRGTLMGLALRAPGNKKALCVSFGSLGLSKTLIRIFTKVGSLNFDPTYRKEDEPVVLEKDSHGLYQYRILDDIFTKSSKIHNKLNININKLWEDEEVDEHPTITNNDYKIQFAVIGPIVELRHLATAEQLLESFQSKAPTDEYCKFARNAVLVIIELEGIEGTYSRNQFFHLKPPKKYFRDFDPKVKDTSKQMKWPLRDAPDDTKLQAIAGPANPKKGITLQCGDTKCKFKIRCYQFGDIPAHPQQSEVKLEETAFDGAAEN